MPLVRLAALLAAMTLLVAACGGDDDQTGTASATSADVEEPTGDAGDAELDEDVAAVVNDEEIASAGIDSQVEALADNPRFAQQLEGPQAEQNLALVRADLLTTAIHTLVAIEGAEELDRPVTDEDIATARAEVEDQLGGPDALDEAIDEQGMTESQVEDQLSGLAALRNIELALAEAAGDEDGTGDADGTGGDGEAGDEEGAGDDAAPDDGAPGDQSPTPAEQEAQRFLGEQLAAADVSVNADYGTWDPQSSRVVPPGGLPTGPMPGGAGPGGDPAGP